MIKYFFNKVTFLLLLLIVLVRSIAAQTKPVEGTWINLTYQDVRNKYMNPAHVDYYKSSFWEEKLKEQAELGLEYIVIMAVANNQKAFYPSDFMKLSYPKGLKSPLEAIMETADQLDLKVFMSSGWAINQDDDLREPEIKELQQKIMIEVAEKFKHHKSFFGWYLPVEDSLEPYLPNYAVEAVNSLADKARSLTPGKKIMISPYGICYADMKSEVFANQIKRLKVDIIAYQDEIGCVREPMPMKRMKEHFKILGEIHKNTNIAFWANIESFTWEKKPNDRESALVPASFARYLSQMVGVSQAGAEKIISFSSYGIFDKPSSSIPIGQPYYSIKGYGDLMDWKHNRGRWNILEATFKDDVDHMAIGKKVYSDTNNIENLNLLVDKKLGVETIEDNNWVDFGDQEMGVIIDLGESIEINTLVARFLNYKNESVQFPTIVHFYISNDNKSFKRVKSVVMESSVNDKHDCWIDIAFSNNISSFGRYVKIETDSSEDMRIFCDEILVNVIM